MATCEHNCPGCGRHQAANSIVVRVEPLAPEALAREIRRQIRRLGLGRGNES